MGDEFKEDRVEKNEISGGKIKAVRWEGERLEEESGGREEESGRNRRVVGRGEWWEGARWKGVRYKGVEWKGVR